MKKQLAIGLCLILCLALITGCSGKNSGNNVTFTAIIEGVGEDSILVTTTGDADFDKASVKFTDDLKLDFELGTGQTVKITIKPEIAESYPVQVTAVAIELVSQPQPEPAEQ